ncbi:MAG: tRNA uracil 4-sulfurtransferase ThiI [Euryarchaeota archaeon]|nr:tRNA uracil 4-sulfurtransferase ThiI [Euryarchaeota archaeon]
MPSFDSVLVRYGEIALKDSWTRRAWERILASNIATVLQEAGIEHQVSGERGRIFVRVGDPEASRLIADVFGVVSASPVCTVPPEMETVARVACELAVDSGLSSSSSSPSSFAIRSRRAGGEITSTQIAVEVGRAVQERTGARVDLDRPELEIFVEAREDRVLVFTEVVPGVGGLPLGSQPRMVALVSGGIDSPVAAWMMMRRGCPVSLLYFDPRPYADARAQALGSAEVLRRWTSGRKISFIQVPMGESLERIVGAHRRDTCLLCRRLMYRVSALVMEEEEAFGVVTGYSLGQVASQTPANIMAEQAEIDLPIYHPLIAMDKTEIVDFARKIGTYQVTEDAGGCLAAPKKPMTRARVQDVLAAEAELGIEEMAEEVFAGRVRWRV